MHALITVGGHDYRVDLSSPLDISIPLDFEGQQPAAFGIPAASAVPFRAGAFVGAVSRGGSANCYTVTITPHGNGTHTESVGHILSEPVPIGEELHDSFVAATLLSVELTQLASTRETYASLNAPDDLVITAASLTEGLERVGGDVTWLDGLVLRTRPNDPGKRRASYSGQNPAYLTDQAMAWVRAHQVRHLLVDVPSVDREEDSGELCNHRMFWGVEPGAVTLQGASTGRTITEMIYVSDALHEGPYLLNIQVPNFVLDAAPSRPRLFPVERWLTSV